MLAHVVSSQPLKIMLGSSINTLTETGCAQFAALLAHL